MEMVDKLDTKYSRLTIITDCMFWIDMCEKYMKNWNSETFNEKTNSDLTTRMWRMYNKLSKRGDIIFMHIIFFNSIYSTSK